MELRSEIIIAEPARLPWRRNLYVCTIATVMTLIGMTVMVPFPEADATSGPITTRAQYEKIQSYFDIARKEGLTCAIGGEVMPCGGFGQSGYGRGQGIEALAHYTQLKSIIIKL